MIPKGYRTATAADYAYIVHLLTDGDKGGVLVLSSYRSENKPYPLMDVSQGPYWVSEDGIEGQSRETGRPETIRITNTPRHYVERRPWKGNWYPPEMGSVTLLIPE